MTIDEVLKQVSKWLYIAGFILNIAYAKLKLVGLHWVPILVLVIATCLYLLSGYVRRKQNKKKPITTVYATVVGRRIECYGRRNMMKRYYLSFRPVQGMNCELEVSYNEFHAYTEGDTGILCHRTWEYFSFTRCAVPPEANPVSLEVTDSIIMQEYTPETGKDDSIRML